MEIRPRMSEHRGRLRYNANYVYHAPWGQNLRSLDQAVQAMKAREAQDASEKTLPSAVETHAAELLDSLVAFAAERGAQRPAAACRGS